jgi:hypothetical protein
MFENILHMFSVHVMTFITIYLHTIKCDIQKLIVPCFAKHINVEIHQFNNRIPIRYINCTRHRKKHLFTISFELQRRLITFDHMDEYNMVVTLFAGPCSSSTATLSTGRTFPSIHGTLSWNGHSQQGTIAYEYGGGGADFAQLVSVLIHVVIRNGREDMIKGIYVIKFNS